MDHDHLPVREVELDLVTAPDMSLEIAQALVERVKEHASTLAVRLAVVIVDRGGNIVAAARMDGAQLGAYSLAADKAVTAVSFGYPTAAWIQSSAPGGSDWGLAGTLSGRAIVFPGGLPIYATGRLVGGIGVSGAASTVDEACAAVALDALGLRSEA